MKVKIRQALTPEDLCEARCCVCRRTFYRSVAEAYLFTDFGMDIGEICPACLEAGPEHIEREIQDRARDARADAEELERAAAEPVEDCPSIEEYLAMEQAIGEPRYASFEEADQGFPRAMGYID
jgi:hypothetical protein